MCALELVPRVHEWKPDLVVHPVAELAGAVAVPGADEVLADLLADART